MSATQEHQLALQATPAADTHKRRCRDWTQAEEQRLVDILSEHADRAAILIHNRSNDTVWGANKTAIAKEIGLQLRADDPPDAKVVLQKVKSLKDWFKAWYDWMSQTGQGFLLSDLHTDSPLLRERNRILQEEPWFDNFHQLYINRQPAQNLDIFSGGFLQESPCSQLPAFSHLQLNSHSDTTSQSLGIEVDDSNSDDNLLPSMGTLNEHHQHTPLRHMPAPSASSSRSNISILSPDQISSQLGARKEQLVKKQKHSIFHDDQNSALSQSQVHISDNNLKAVQLQTEHQMALHQEEHVMGLSAQVA